MWADHILLRLADLIGLEKVQECLRRKVRVYSFFAGMDCQRFAWSFLCAACKRLWGFEPAVTFDFTARNLGQAVCRFVRLSERSVCCAKVEKNKVKQAMLNKWHPDDNENCIFGDIMSMIKNKSDGKKLLNWKKIVWKKSSWCAKQNRECPISLPKPDDTESLNVLGAPCVLFSKNLVGQRPVFLCIYDS